MAKVESVISPIWNLALPILEDNSIKYFEYKEVRERNVSVKGLTKFEYQVNDVDAFLLPSKAFLELKVALTKADGSTAWAADEYLCAQNGIPFFKEATLKINGKIIERVDDVYRKMLVNGLMNYSDDFARTGASQENWFLDTGTGAADNLKYFPTLAFTLTAAPALDTYKISAVENPTYNEGFAQRAKRASESAIMVLRVPLNRLFGYFAQDRISTGVTMSINLTKNDDTVIIHTATAAAAVAAGKLKDSVKEVLTPKTVISHLSLWMCYVKPSLAAEAMIKSALASNISQDFSFEYQQVYQKNFAKEDTQPLWTIGSFGEKPLKLVAFFVPTASLTSYTANSAIFQHLKLIRASFKIGQSKYPEYDFEPNFETKDYSRLYNEYLRCSDRSMFFDGGSQVSYETFQTLYPMVCADLRESDDSLFTPGQVTDITFKASLSAAAAADYTVFCVVTSERRCRLDVIDRRMLIDVV